MFVLSGFVSGSSSWGARSAVTYSAAETTNPIARYSSTMMAQLMLDGRGSGLYLVVVCGGLDCCQGWPIGLLAMAWLVARLTYSGSGWAPLVIGLARQLLAARLLSTAVMISNAALNSRYGDSRFGWRPRFGAKSVLCMRHASLRLRLVSMSSFVVRFMGVSYKVFSRPFKNKHNVCKSQTKCLFSFKEVDKTTKNRHKNDE